MPDLPVYLVLDKGNPVGESEIGCRLGVPAASTSVGGVNRLQLTAQAMLFFALQRAALCAGARSMEGFGVIRSIAVLGAALVPLLMASCGGGGDVADSTASVEASACSAERACVSTIMATDPQFNADGTARTAQLRFPHRVALDAAGNLQIGDFGNGNHVLLIRSDGSVSTSDTAPIEFPYPNDAAVDGLGNRYVADRYNNRILKTTPDGRTVTVAGLGAAAGGDVDGDARIARFSLPMGIALGPEGNLYVADTGNGKIRKITLPQR